VKGSIRLRLTLWYASALAVVMAAYGAFVYAAVRADLRAELGHALHEDEQVVRAIADHAATGADWRAEMAKHWSEDEAYERRVVVRRPEGAVLFESEHPDDDAPLERATFVGQLDGGEAHVEYARSRERMDEQLGRLLLVLALGLPLGVGFAAAGGWFLARRALAPVGRMADHASAIGASNLSARLPVDNPTDEIGRLATVFNETLARLEGSFERLRRFTADASHELRTPLTALRAVGEVGLRERRTAEQYRDIVGSMLEEVDRLARLVDSLLTLSRADAGRIALRPETFDLGGLAREVASHLSVLAEEKGQRLDVAAQGEVPVTADRAILRLAVVNLIDNAVKYAPSGTTVRVDVEVRDGVAALRVSDAGPGIAQEHHARLFDRFYRVDPARSREDGGTGLGLAIARWATEAHGGRIELASEPGRGSRFTVVLPRRADPSAGGTP
jgi:heavy metal sensor kinase